MHQDTSYAFDDYEDEPAQRLSRELQLPAEQRHKIIEILDDARRNDLSRENTLLAVRSVLKPYQQDMFDRVMGWSWWKDWPWVTCTAFDEASMQSCSCDSCIHYRVERSRREQQDREFEAMLDELRERAKKPFYKDWEVPE